MVNGERLRLDEADTGGVPWRRWGPYLYLDATPSSSYLRMLCKYPQAEFPDADLIAVNAARGQSDPDTSWP